MDPELLNVISTHYNLPSLTLQKAVTEGVLSNNYILKDDTHRYFLKQWRFTDITRVQEITRVEQHFAQHEIPVILPLSTCFNTYVVAHLNALYTLYPYIQGHHIEGKDLHGPALDSMAEMLATIHLISKVDPLQIHEHLSLRDNERSLAIIYKLQEVIENIPHKSEFDLLATKQLNRKESLIKGNAIQLTKGTFPLSTLIHGDYHEFNIFFEEDTVSHVFDLEKTEMAPRAFELIRCVELTLINGEYSEFNLERAAHFIATYSQIYPITPQEVRDGLDLYFFKRINGHWIEEEHYLKDNNRVDIFLERTLKSLFYMADHLQEVGDSLVSQLH